MAMFIRANGKMIELKGMGCMYTLTELSTMVNGKMTSSMARVSKLGLMAHLTKEVTSRVLSMERVILFGQIKVSTQENSGIIILKEKVFIFGIMVGLMTVNGSTTKWRVMVFSHGLMVASTLANTLTIKSKELVNFTGLMVVYMMAIGTMENKKARALIQLRTAKRKRANGQMVKGLHGCENDLIHIRIQ